MRVKGKLRTFGQVGLALALVLTLGLVMAVPAAASPDVEGVKVSVIPPTAGSVAEYSIKFTPNVGLYPPGNVIVVTFPAGTYVPKSSVENKANILVRDLEDGEQANPNKVLVEYQYPLNPISGWSKVTVWLPPYSNPPVPSDVEIDYQHEGQVVFSTACGIKNPVDPGQYCLTLHTDEEPNPVQGCYNITMGPVDVYLKYQLPIEKCGYIELEHVQSFETIQDGLDKANEVFLDMYSPTPGPGDLGLYVECPDSGGYVGIKVVVQPGTYHETIVMDTPGVELCSKDGAAATIIDAYNYSYIDSYHPNGRGLLPAEKNAVVFITTGGVTFQGFTVMNGGKDLYSDYPDYANWEMDSDPYADIMGIAVLSSWSDKSGSTIADAMATAADARVNILDNIVYANQATGIAGWSGCVLVNGNDVHDNDWDGFHGGENLFVGVEIIDPVAYNGGYRATIEITDNMFYDNGDDGVEITNAYGHLLDNVVSVENFDGIMVDLYIVGNNIHDNADAGIQLKEGATGEGNSTVIAIKFNQIRDNDVGICTAAMYPTFNIACVYNNIEGNSVWGIKNWDEDLLLAKLNWWGDLSGPSSGVAPTHPTESNPDQTAQPPALGIGDAVSHHVIYQWWLTDEFENVQEDLIRYYGSDRYQGMDNDPYSIPWAPIIPLKQGWNTLSTPVALNQSADQLGEIVGLGGWMQNYVIGYSYDPTGGWQLLTGDFQFLPLEAVYVRIQGPESYDPWADESYADLFPILLRTSMWLPARDLEPGWNLVGMNADFWNEEYDGCITSEAVDKIFSSISGSWSNAISPSMPGQVENWVCTPSNAGDFDMFTGDGYWVFITKSTTMAGFSIAPWYLNEWEMDILGCRIPYMPF